MLDNDYTLQHYMNEISPLVNEHQEEKRILRDFEKTLHELQDEAKRCKDAFTIYQAWQDGIGRSLTMDYSEEELLELHDASGGRMEKRGTLYIVITPSQVLSFFLCQHRIYTPVLQGRGTNHCLHCI